MLADPMPGDTYRQEYQAGNAEDVAMVLRTGDTVTVPAGRFESTLTTADWTPLEPKVLERKWYAQGVGIVRERTVRGGHDFAKLVRMRTPG